MASWSSQAVLPTSNGFDTYFGIPYSNDMNHPDNKGKPKGGLVGMVILWKDPESTLTKWKTPLENENHRVACGPAQSPRLLKNQSILSKKIKPNLFLYISPFNATYPSLCT